MHHGEKLRRIKERVDAAREALLKKHAKEDTPTAAAPQPPSNDDENLAYTSPAERYHIAQSQRHHNNILNWLDSYDQDPALMVSITDLLSVNVFKLSQQNFYRNLKDHLLTRIEECGISLPDDAPGTREPGEYSFYQRSRLVIHKELAYWHDVLRLNWTSYDIRRSQDSVNLNTHRDIMLLADVDHADPTAHPYIYARVIRIFHVNVRLYDSPMQEFERVDVLFVRYFRLDRSRPGGFAAKRLHRVQFVPCADADQEAFGFIDPAQVIRGSHLIPAFAFGRTNSLLGPSMARDVAANEPAERHDTDWKYYYVNLSVPHHITRHMLN